MGRSQRDRLRSVYVEIIELLLDAGEVTAAEQVLAERSRMQSQFGRAGKAIDIWQDLPAVDLGQRCEMAFVRRARIDPSSIDPRRAAMHLAGVGLYTMMAGDLVSAEQFIRETAAFQTQAGDMANLSKTLQNLADCLCGQGRVRDAIRAATEATHAFDTWQARACLAWTLEASGETWRAEELYAQAQSAALTRMPGPCGLHSLWGSWWSEFLLRTGRTKAARRQAKRNLEVSRELDRTDDIARCQRLLGLCDLARGDAQPAVEKLSDAAKTFRDGEMLTELAATLVDLSEAARSIKDGASALRYSAEAINIAAPRGLIPIHSAALAARAVARVYSPAADPHSDHIHVARDDADLALRLATKICQLPWQELAALQSHAAIDEAVGSSGGWSEVIAARRTFLIPRGLRQKPGSI